MKTVSVKCVQQPLHIVGLMDTPETSGGPAGTCVLRTINALAPDVGDRTLFLNKEAARELADWLFIWLHKH